MPTPVILALSLSISFHLVRASPNNRHFFNKNKNKHSSVCRTGQMIARGILNDALESVERAVPSGLNADFIALRLTNEGHCGG